MKVLIVGGGGREHALAWKVAQSSRVRAVYVAPGNGGTQLEPRVDNLAIPADDIPALRRFAVHEQIDLTIVGPEAPLVAGIVDAFQEAGLRCFGPSRRAAQLEGSKAFSKDFLARHGIPTARYRVFDQVQAAKAYVRGGDFPVVVKADGLAAGKGVVIAQSEAEACGAIDDMLEGNAFGVAGHRVVVEEFLHGEEASFIVMADGEHVLPLATSQDHKARDDGDRGPNTGGMGAYSPAPVITPEIHARVMDEIIHPTLTGMADEGIPYTGFLYAGLMIDAAGVPRVLEFNCRLGDPEAQPILMRLRSDLVELCLAACDRRLHTTGAVWDERVALGVVLAAGGYPNHYAQNDVISGWSAQAADCKVFHAGTRYVDGTLVTTGGRVLCVCALGDTVATAHQKAYGLISRIHWRNMYHRADIGHRAMARMSSP
jgi:phosphoribosylamine--glycine ligase